MSLVTLRTPAPRLALSLKPQMDSVVMTNRPTQQRVPLLLYDLPDSRPNPNLPRAPAKMAHILRSKNLRVPFDSLHLQVDNAASLRRRLGAIDSKTTLPALRPKSCHLPPRPVKQLPLRTCVHVRPEMIASETILEHQAVAQHLEAHPRRLGGRRRPVETVEMALKTPVALVRELNETETAAALTLRHPAEQRFTVARVTEIREMLGTRANVLPQVVPGTTIEAATIVQGIATDTMHQTLATENMLAGMAGRLALHAQRTTQEEVTQLAVFRLRALQQTSLLASGGGTGRMRYVLHLIQSL